MTESAKTPAPSLQLRQPEFTSDVSEPFTNDRLNRQSGVKALCRRIGQLTGPAALAVCGDFGEGKTAFLRMCSAHLRSQGTAVVDYNVWLKGHTGEPMRDLLSVLSNDLDKPKALQDLLRKMVERGLRKISGGLVEPTDFERQIPEVMREWEEADEIRHRLQEALTQAAQNRNGKLVILIDELDRCLPKYALGTLNAVRNLLDVPGVVVVLGLNRREVAARIRQLYGSNTDAQKFLGRFVDYSIDLKRPNALSGGMDQFLDEISARANTNDWLKFSTREYTSLMVKVMVDRFEMSLRDAEQLVHRVAVSLGMSETTSARPEIRQLLLPLLALRVGDPNAYQALLRDRDSVFDSARILSHKLAVTPDDHVGLQMIALLILACVDNYHDLTLESFKEVMQSLESPGIDPQIIEPIWSRYTSMRQGRYWALNFFQELTDLIELSA